MAFFRSIFLEIAARHPDIAADCMYVDATALRLVRAPWEFDVLVTENMFGDILSDLGAALMGGMGMAPRRTSATVRPSSSRATGHAPDIAGRGVANPTAMFLSAAMMLDWLGEQHAVNACQRAGRELTLAVERAFGDETLIPIEFGGTADTEAIFPPRPSRTDQTSGNRAFDRLSAAGLRVGVYACVAMNTSIELNG